jgi:hypothetical protein
LLTAYLGGIGRPNGLDHLLAIHTELLNRCETRRTLPIRVV